MKFTQRGSAYRITGCPCTCGCEWYVRLVRDKKDTRKLVRQTLPSTVMQCVKCGNRYDCQPGDIEKAARRVT